MYDNIGGKLKGLAKVTFVIIAIAVIIIGIALMTSDEDLIVAGLLVIVLGLVSAWVSTLMTYGFGELIDKVSNIERNTRGTARKSEAQSKVDYERMEKIEKLRTQGLITEEEYRLAIAKE